MSASQQSPRPGAISRLSQEESKVNHELWQSTICQGKTDGESSTPIALPALLATDDSPLI